MDIPKSWKQRLPDSAAARLHRLLRDTHDLVGFPAFVLHLFFDKRIRPEYGMTWPKRIRLAWRFYLNTRRVETASSYRAHVAMAVTLLEMPRSAEGVVVECGCFRGGSTANLSIVCDIVGRDLIVYDSFEGLPPPSAGDHRASPYAVGLYHGALGEVRSNVERLGVIERCTFRQGWFEDTLPSHTEPIVLCFLDVDFHASTHQCLINLWPHLLPTGYLFSDDFARLESTAVFFSERYWRTYFDRPPPGLMGTGSGVGLGHYSLGPYGADWLPLQGPMSVAYTKPNLTAEWDYFPDETAPEAAT